MHLFYSGAVYAVDCVHKLFAAFFTFRVFEKIGLEVLAIHDACCRDACAFIAVTRAEY